MLFCVVYWLAVICTSFLRLPSILMLFWLMADVDAELVSGPVSPKDPSIMTSITLPPQRDRLFPIEPPHKAAAILGSRGLTTTKDVGSPKSVICDPRLGSPVSSASASLERRLCELKKAPRQDQVYSISDAEEENLPSAAGLTRQLSTKDYESERNGLVGHPLPSVPGRMGLASGPPSQTSSPRNRIARSINKDGSKYVRASENDFSVRRLAAAPGADTISNSGSLPHPTELGVEKDSFTFTFAKPLELGFLLGKDSWRNLAGIRPFKYKSLERQNLSSSRLIREDVYKATNVPSVSSSSIGSEEPLGASSVYDMLLSSLYGPLEQIVSGKGRVDLGEGRYGLAGYRHKTRSLFSPGDSPGHPPSFGDSPRSALMELSSDVVVKETSKVIKEFTDIPYSPKNGGKPYSSLHEAFDSVPSIRLAEGRRKSDGHLSSACIVFPTDEYGHSSLHSMPTVLMQAQAQGNMLRNSYSEGQFEKNQFGGKYSGFIETVKNGLLVPQQRLVPGQFLKSNPFNPRPQPAKWDDAEKWLVSSGTVKSGTHAQHGNGGGRHGRPHSLKSSPGNNESLQHNVESYESRLMPDDGVLGGNSFPVGSGTQTYTVDANTKTTGDGQDGLVENVKQNKSDAPLGDAIVARSEDKFADTITVQNTSPNNGRLVIVMKDAATEITPSTSQRDIAMPITPAQSFHSGATPPRLQSDPARLNTTPVHSERRTASVGVDVSELQNCHQAKLDLDQVAAIDTSWTTREEEVEESGKSLRLSVDFKEVKRNVLEARAAAWEEAEQSKYMSRYHREEAKIVAWEAHQKAKAEAEMRKVEVKLERMRSHANEILQNKIASVHMRAENMRAAAAAAYGERAAKTNEWAQHIRASGRSPSSTLLCCLPSCFSS
ncbi:hypothetical protein R1sor_004568 [Riccia sorocarpa]|uniref:Remorin C-terminal domain-containing protein n=1 Tax=Riccia sorocarpa TaxID=122646 RepID=A0ABD3HHA9_9MARC